MIIKFDHINEDMLQCSKYFFQNSNQIQIWLTAQLSNFQ